MFRTGSSKIKKTCRCPYIGRSLWVIRIGDSEKSVKYLAPGYPYHISHQPTNTDDPPTDHPAEATQFSGLYERRLGREGRIGCFHLKKVKVHS